MNKKIIYLTLILTASLSCKQGNNTTGNDTNADSVHDGDHSSMPPANMNEKDRDFMMKAGYVNYGEIELGKMAEKKSKNDSVQHFGEHMAKDHDEALDDLKALGKDVNVEIPDELDGEHQAMKDKLENLSGYSFDTAYMNGQINGHEKVIALFESEINEGSNEQVKDYAKKYLPVIREHHEMAKNTKARLRK